MHRKALSVLVPLTVMVALTAAVRLAAGGWAVVTLDTLPESAVVATPLRVSFTVRQHGQTLLDGLEPRVRAVAGAERIESAALPTGKKGQYAASLTFPRPADWVITVESGFMDSRLSLLPLPVVSEANHAASSMTPVGRGLRLFVAKGCVTCHQNNIGSDNRSLGFAPALVAGKHQNGLLASMLLKPESVLPLSQQPVGTMPNLNLQPEEATALVAFINNVGTAIGSR